MTVAMLALGILVGLSSGLLSERLALTAMSQSLASAMVAALLSTVAVSVAWLRGTADQLGSAALTFDVPRAVLALVLVLALAAALHVGLGWLGTTVHPLLGSHRPVTLGLFVGLLSAAALLAAFRSPQ